MLRSRGIALVKVLWRNHGVEETTWEREDYMKVDGRRSLPHTVLHSSSEPVSSSPTPHYECRRPAARHTPSSFSPSILAGSFPRQPSRVDQSCVFKPFTWSLAASSRRGVAADEQLAVVVVECQPIAPSLQTETLPTSLLRNPSRTRFRPRQPNLTRVSSPQTEPAPAPTPKPAPAAHVSWACLTRVAFMRQPSNPSRFTGLAEPPLFS
ncbi:Chromo domain-containing protein [Cucumis melo var. makuwa]|uniref:Chromo domain-containing protein n=1 Tax=Cucumis melo var. makuwa TaxID=1194695 RepID=A0A5D3CIE9_CUCMM|nr:Chromo domain-containing protein [Cucumis melo var. makuwa]